MNKIRFGLIGCGDIAHIRYFYSIPHFEEIELVGIYDMNKPFLQKTAEELGVKAFNSYEEMLDDPTIDAVIVTTYHPSHTPLAIQALKAGKHVISEKPVSVSIEQAKQLKEAADQTDKVFMAMPNDAYPQIEKVKELIEQGVIGEVCAIDSVFAHHGPLHAPWFFDYEKAQWGVLADLGVYSISTLSYLFGPVARVYGETRCFEKRRISDAGEEFIPSVEDNVAATLVWDDGKVATMRSNWCTGVHKDHGLWRFTFNGSKGIIHLDMARTDHPIIVVSPNCEIPGAEKVSFMGQDYCYSVSVGKVDNNDSVLELFLDAIKNNRKFPDNGCSIVRQNHVIEIIDRIYESSRTGKAYEITSKF